MMSPYNSFISNKNLSKSIIFGYIRQHEPAAIALELGSDLPDDAYRADLEYPITHDWLADFKTLTEDDFKDNDIDWTSTPIVVSGNLERHKYNAEKIQNIATKENIPVLRWICPVPRDTNEYTELSNVMVQWTFFMKKIKRVMFFGLASNDESINTNFCNVTVDRPYYRVDNTGYRYKHYFFVRILGEEIEVKWKSGDTITFMLYLNNTTRLFCIQVNDQPQITIFNGIMTGMDINYTMALQMPFKYDCVILKNFQKSDA